MDPTKLGRFQKGPQIKKTSGSEVNTFPFLVLPVYKGHLALVYDTPAERKRGVIHQEFGMCELWHIS